MIGGGYEFVAPGSANGTDSKAVAKFKQAVDLLPYDIFTLSPMDAHALSTANLTPSPAWTGPATAPVLFTGKTSGGKIAFVTFPDSAQADQGLGDTLTSFAQSLRATGEYNLIVGISTWGAGREEAFISNYAPEFDIILGSGDGPGYTGLYLRDNKILWIRAFSKGKNLLTVTIPSLPPTGTKVVWDPEVSVRTAAIPLGPDIPSDPRIDAIFAP